MGLAFLLGKGFGWGVQTPNVSATKRLTEETGLDVIASGGVSCMEDLQTLYEAGIQGAIMGKALYEKKIDLREAVRRFEGFSIK